MTEKLPSTSTAETPVLDPEAIDTGEATSAETTAEAESPTERRLKEARQRLSDLLDEREVPAADEETDETEEPTPEADEPADDTETDPEKKEKRSKNFLKKIGGWAVKSLEANGFIPQRGKWHKRDGFTGFIAKAYVYSKQRKAARVAGFLSAEANAQLSGETEPDSPETADDDEEETRDRLHRRMGRGAVALAGKTIRSPKVAYRTFKAIKNVK